MATLKRQTGTNIVTDDNLRVLTSLGIPYGPTDPAISGSDKYLFYNTTSEQLKVYNGTTWVVPSGNTLLTPYLSRFEDYTVLISDFGANGELIIYVNTTSTSVNITLPSASSMSPSNKTYRLIVIKQDTSVNSVNILGGATNINGATTYTITGSYGSVEITSNSFQYFAR